MVIDFSKIDMRKRPKFILKNLDGTPIGYLGHILEPNARICFTEVSELNFKYPSVDNGEKLDEYDLLTSMRVIDVEGYGQFLLQSPVENNDTVVKIKTCTAYSLEYELTGKKITLEEGTYNFWNPLAPDGTIMGIILSELPSWSIGTVSSDLIGKYRTYSADNQSVYDFMKSKLQESYDCIFDFDTYERKINIKSLNDLYSTKPVYLSAKNLLSEIEIEENANELVTVLDVHGAEDLDIRNVNPMGINKIYNLDAYMNKRYFSDEMITGWQNWKQTFDSYRQTYFDMSVEKNMLISRLVTENAVLADLEGELSGLESKKAALVQGVIIDSSLIDDLEAVKAAISEKEKEINNQKKDVITPIENKITTITNQLKNINQLTAFSAFFSEEQIVVLDRYFKCGSLTDSTFVATNIDNYSTDGTTVRDLASIFNLIGLNEINRTEYTSDKTFYSIRGGKIETSNSGFSLNAEIVYGTLEVNDDKTFVISLYLNSGNLNSSTSFTGATLSMTGNLNADVIITESSLQFKTSSANVYFTRNVSEYQKQSVAMELYDYASQYLEKASQLTYYFSVDSGNFFAIDDFVEFAKQFSLGERLYLHLNENVYEPYVLAVSVDFDDLTEFSIEFNEYFQAKEGIMDIRQILEQAVSSSNSLDFNQYLYSSFVTSGAKTSVEQFMKSAIDAMKNNIMAGENNELKIDGTGLRCMKYDEETDSYSPKQIWMAHNTIMFTEDNWESATIGIGEFKDKNFGTIYGIVLPALVGTLLAGQNLIIESEKQDGGVAVFKMDAEGASLHNASFNLYGSTGGRIDMGAILGLVGGNDPNNMFVYDEFNNPIGVKTAKNDSVTKVSELGNDTPNANFWLDMDGGLYLKGVIDAVGGIFRGSLEVGGVTAFRVDSRGNLKIGGTETNPNFSVDANGNLIANSGTFKGKIYGNKLFYNNGEEGSQDINMMEEDKIKSSYLKLKGITVENDDEDITFKVDDNGNVSVSGSIIMGQGSSINWSNITETNYNKSEAYKLADRAYDLAYDNQLPSYIQSTYIDAVTIKSPKIEANEFNVYPNNSGGNSGGFNIYGKFSSGSTAFGHMFALSYYNGDAPYINFSSPVQCIANWNFGTTYYHGDVTFSEDTNMYGNIFLDSSNFGTTLPAGSYGRLFFLVE